MSATVLGPKGEGPTQGGRKEQVEEVAFSQRFTHSLLLCRVFLQKFCVVFLLLLFCIPNFFTVFYT